MRWTWLAKRVGPALGAVVLAAGLMAAQPGRPVRQNVQQDFRQGNNRFLDPVYAVNRNTGLMQYNRSGAFGDPTYRAYERYVFGPFSARPPANRSGAYGRPLGPPIGPLAASQYHRPYAARGGHASTLRAPSYRPPSAGPPRSSLRAPTYSSGRQSTRISSSSFRVRP